MLLFKQQRIEERTHLYKNTHNPLIYKELQRIFSFHQLSNKNGREMSCFYRWLWTFALPMFSFLTFRQLRTYHSYRINGKISHNL